MKHLDHSMIFVLIAGSFSPIALLALRPSWSVAMVSIAWAGALIGVLVTVAGLDRLHRAGLVLYLTLGWLPIVAAAQLVRRGLTFGELALLLGGGVVYTAGAAMLAAKRPFPRNVNTRGLHPLPLPSLESAGRTVHRPEISEKEKRRASRLSPL